MCEGKYTGWHLICCWVGAFLGSWALVASIGVGLVHLGLWLADIGPW